MKVKLLKDWSFHKAGDVVEVFEPTARNWIVTGIAESVSESRSLPTIEDATDGTPTENASLVSRKRVK